MPHLVVEIGCEELPAHSVESAISQFAENMMEGLRAANLLPTDDAPKMAGTPRRIIFGLNGIVERQPDERVSKRGPAAKSAFSEDGTPAPPLIGFCKSLGIDPSQVEIRDDYAWADVTILGKSAEELLCEIIPTAIQGISFSKTMRWGAGRMRFSRPLRWILAVFDNKPLKFQVESVESGAESKGHRFHSPGSFSASSFDELMDSLKSRQVEADLQRRKELVVSQARACSPNVLLTEELIDENVNLCEWPIAIAGTFRDEFSTLPRPVLVTAMAKHERFFPIQNGDGSLTNQFVSITNGGEVETVRRGNEWVLNARFNDAKFFYDEDSKTSLSEFLERTERIVFQEKLGTIRQRAERLASLSKQIAEKAGISPEDVALAEIAGRFAKADLSTGLVSELPSLQGKVGGEYARQDGMPAAICDAIYSHYFPEPSEILASVVMCADQADRLAGYLGIGEIPSGSSDPFAIRKAMTMLIDAQMNREFNSSIVDWVLAAAEGYRKQNISIVSNDEIEVSLLEILQSRYEAMFSEIGYDVREAVWASQAKSTVSNFVETCKVVTKFVNDVRFVRAAKRPANILAAAKKKGFEPGNAVDQSLFEHESEGQLFAKVNAPLEELVEPIDAFFDGVMVMTEDSAKRNNRLTLLSMIDARFKQLADFSKIVIEGE